MVYLDVAGNSAPILLSVRCASQCTNGMLTERRIWQLVKSKQIATLKDSNGKVAIQFGELMRFLNEHNSTLAA